MGYAVYEDTESDRWAGYGVPAECDWADCHEMIDRGLGYKCETHWLYPDDGSEVEAEGCGLFFCSSHEQLVTDHANVKPKGESQEWMRHVLTDDSWGQWREENPRKTAEYKGATL